MLADDFDAAVAAARRIHTLTPSDVDAIRHARQALATTDTPPYGVLTELLKTGHVALFSLVCLFSIQAETSLAAAAEVATTPPILAEHGATVADLRWPTHALHPAYADDSIEWGEYRQSRWGKAVSQARTRARMDTLLDSQLDETDMPRLVSAVREALTLSNRMVADTVGSYSDSHIECVETVARRIQDTLANELLGKETHENR